MVELIRQEGMKEQANDKIMAAVLKCSSSLGIDLTPDQISTMAEDILEVYKYDSLEDVITCLKQARQGIYADIPHYGKLNMIVFQQWMAKHLDKKYEAKEKELEAKKKIEDSEEPFDREKFYDMTLYDKLKAIRDQKDKADDELRKFKAERYKQSLNNNDNLTKQ